MAEDTATETRHTYSAFLNMTEKTKWHIETNGLLFCLKKHDNSETLHLTQHAILFIVYLDQ